MKPGGRLSIKIAVAVGTALGLLSYGGELIFLFIPLTAGYWWVVRHAGAVERWAWIAIASITAASWAWQVTYPVHEGDGSAPLLISVGGGLIGAVLLRLATRYRIVRDDSHPADASAEKTTDSAGGA